MTPISLRSSTALSPDILQPAALSTEFWPICLTGQLLCVGAAPRRGTESSETRESLLTLLRPAAAIHEGSRQSNAAASPVLTSSDCTALSSAVGTSLLAPKLACKLTNQLFRDFFWPAPHQARGELKTALRREGGRRRGERFTLLPSQESRPRA